MAAFTQGEHAQGEHARNVHYVGGIGDWLDYHALHHPHREALVVGDRRLDYGQLSDRCCRMAGVLAARGVRKGDRVALLLFNGNAFIETLFACAKLGAIAVPINFRLSSAEVEFILDDCGARVLVYHTTFSPLVAPIRRNTPLEHALYVTAAGDPMPADEDYEDVLAAAQALTSVTPVAQDDPHLMMYTSGTTGRPKGAVLTHGNTTWNAFNLLLSESALVTDDVVLTVAPLFHIGGLNIHTLPALYKGAKVVMHPHFDPAETLRLVERERVTTLFLVPAMWLAISQLPDIDRYDLSSLRVLMSGGAPCPITVIEFFQERGLRFLEGFGMTETAPNACFLSSQDTLRKNGSVGKPLTHMQMRIVDADDQDVAPGETGELVLRGPNLFIGYWNRSEATEEAFRGGWFHSGDLACQDEEGFFYIVDRIKDMLISGGENVYPTEIEQVLYRHPAVREAAVIGVPDAQWGEVPLLVVAPKEGVHLTLDEVRRFCEGKLAHFKVPKQVVEVPALPRTATGKVLKRELRRSLIGADKPPIS